jgi:hypothetical protein
MREVCYCGRSGDVEDREPVWPEYNRRALRCPGCGHLDYLPQLEEGARGRVYSESERRHLARLEEAMRPGSRKEEVAQGSLCPNGRARRRSRCP